MSDNPRQWRQWQDLNGECHAGCPAFLPNPGREEDPEQPDGNCLPEGEPRTIGHPCHKADTIAPLAARVDNAHARLNAAAELHSGLAARMKVLEAALPWEVRVRIRPPRDPGSALTPPMKSCDACGDWSCTHKDSPRGAFECFDPKSAPGTVYSHLSPSTTPASRDRAMGGEGEHDWEMECAARPEDGGGDVYRCRTCGNDTVTHDGQPPRVTGCIVAALQKEIAYQTERRRAAEDAHTRTISERDEALAKLAEAEKQATKNGHAILAAGEIILAIGTERDTAVSVLREVLAAPASLRKLGVAGTENDTIENRVAAGNADLAERARQVVRDAEARVKEGKG